MDPIIFFLYNHETKPILRLQMSFLPTFSIDFKKKTVKLYEIVNL